MCLYCVYCSGESGEPAAKRVKVDDNLDGGMEDLAKSKVTEVRIQELTG